MLYHALHDIYLLFCKCIVKGTYDADTIMMSVLSTIKAQLYPRVTLGNCCSSFHQMVNDFLMEGCGAATRNTFRCLQDSDDPLLVPCCIFNLVVCQEKKERILKMEGRNG
jgi:hypothetical protein